METLPLQVTPDEYERIKQAEAVVVTTFTGPAGRFSKLTYIGTREECEVRADMRRFVVVPNSVECNGTEVVPCSELLPPKNEDYHIQEVHRNA